MKRLSRGSEGRRLAPTGADWNDACATWQRLYSDPDASFDREEQIDATGVEPMVTWGTSPEHAVPITASVPTPSDAADPDQSSSWSDAQDYMGVAPGNALIGMPIDWVFIGSCANSRLQTGGQRRRSLMVGGCPTRLRHGWFRDQSRCGAMRS